MDAETDTIAEKLHTLEGDLPWMYAEAQGLARHALTRQPHKPAKRPNDGGSASSQLDSMAWAM